MSHRLETVLLFHLNDKLFCRFTLVNYSCAIIYFVIPDFNTLLTALTGYTPILIQTILFESSSMRVALRNILTKRLLQL